MTRTFRAVVLHDVDSPVSIRDIYIPKLTTGQVLVKMLFSGVCHTQLLEVRGKRGRDTFLPHLLGHEGSGEVIDVGPSVTKVRVGDSVVCSWIKGRGINVPSTILECVGGGTVNSGALATFAEMSVVSESRLFVLPTHMPMREASLLGCAIPTGAGVVFKHFSDERPGSVAVFGVGGIGLSAILAARARGCFPIIAIDIVERKLRSASELGASHTLLNNSATDVVAAVLDSTNGGVDLAIDASGVKEAMEMAFSVTRRNGGRCVIAGNAPHGTLMSIDPMELIRGKRIFGTVGGECELDNDVPEFSRQFLDGSLPIDRLISSEFTLDEINSAFDALESGLENRAVIRLSA